MDHGESNGPDHMWKTIRPVLSGSVRFMHIAYLEAKSEYQHTRLGLSWIPLSVIVFAGTLALVFKPAGEDRIETFFLYVLVGYIQWSFISDSITGSTTIIQRNLDFALHNNLNLETLFLKKAIDRLFRYLVSLAPAIAIGLAFDWHAAEYMPLLIPMLIIVFVASVSVSYIVNVVTVFYSDMANAINIFMRFLFFASPIFWSNGAEDNTVRHIFSTYNPVSYYLSIARQCLGVEDIDRFDWLVTSGLTLLLAATAAILFTRTSSIVRNMK